MSNTEDKTLCALQEEGYIHEKETKGVSRYCHIEYLRKSGILVKRNFGGDGNRRAHPS